MTVYGFQILPWGLDRKSFKCFEAGEETVVADVHPEPLSCRTVPKPKLRKLIKFNLVEEASET